MNVKKKERDRTIAACGAREDDKKRDEKGGRG